MGLAMEIISGFATNPGASFDVVTNATGDTTAVRNYNPGASAFLLDLWSLNATGGNVRVRSPRMHDNVNGIDLLTAVDVAAPLMAGYPRQLLYAQDVLTVELTGGAAEVDGESMLMYYTDLPGSAARLHTWEEISARIDQLMGVQVDVTPAGTTGDYEGGTEINSLQDQFKANRDYAILGYTTSVGYQSVGVRGPDFANLRVGGPAPASLPVETRDWFVRLGKDNGLPCIPCFNAANKNATIVDVVDTDAVGAGSVTFLCALLRG